MAGLEDFYSGRQHKASTAISGLEANFATRLYSMFQAMPPEIRSTVTILSGYRSVEHQAELWNKKVAEVGEAEARKWVAPPGKSNHGKGLAGDLVFNSEAGRRWVHANATKFGLDFHLKNEDWHIEPQGLRNGSFHSSGRTYGTGEGLPTFSPGCTMADPDAYTDGQGLQQANDNSLETQLLRIADMVSGRNAGAVEQQLQVLDPMATANRNSQMETPQNV